MKLSPNSGASQVEQQIVRTFGIVGLAVGLACWLGWLAGSGEFKYLFLAGAAVVALTAIIGLRERAWMLLPLGWMLTGQIHALALPFAVRDLVIVLAVCAYASYRIMWTTRALPPAHPLDYILVVNILWLGVTFLINPVGLRTLGAETVGARPYFVVGLSVAAYVVLVRLPQSVKGVARLPFLFLVGPALVALLNVLTYLMPALVPYAFMIYGQVDVDAYVATYAGSPILRLKGLARFGLHSMLLLCSYYRPASLFNPLRFRFYGLCLALVCILLSGFRGVFAWLLPALTLGSWHRHRLREAVLALVLCGTLVGGLTFGQGRFYDLPFGVQRTLSFLPGRWSPIVSAEAEESNRWRFELWKRIIHEDLIKNWWVGDGFGVNVRDYPTATGSAAAQTEGFLLTGAYHNGPLSAIRYVGGIGLLLYYVLIISAAVYSVKCVQMCQGTILLPAAIYVSIQLIWYPIAFTFLFGAYNEQLPDQIFMTAALRLLLRMSSAVQTLAPSKPAPVVPP